MHVSKYKQLFVTEARVKVTAIEDTLLALEKKHSDRTSVGTLLKQLHALKGDAATMDYQGLAGALHQLEDFFLRVERGELTIQPSHLDACFIVIDAFRKDIDSIIATDTEIDMTPALAFTLRSGSRRNAPNQKQKEPARQSLKTKYAPLDTYVEVDTSDLEAALSLVNNIIASQHQLQRFIRARDEGALKVGLYTLATHASNLRQKVRDMKLVPVRQYFAFISRLVRDIAREQKKFITFDFNDNDMRFESSVLESLRDVCVQLIKNAIDHGFREGERGTVRLSFALKSDVLRMTVSDNGHGIDWDALGAAALKAGRTTKHRLAQMTPDERARYLLHAGVSSRATASLVSGRGIGLSLVYEKVGVLGGECSIRSSSTGRGKGTVCEVTVPMTPTLFRALTWRWGSYSVALPLFALEGIVHLRGPLSSRKTFLYRGKALPLRSFRYGIDGSDVDATDVTAVAIINHGASRCAMTLPERVREQELILETVPPLRSYHRTIGIAVAEDSTPVCIINPAVLFSKL